MKGKNSNKIKEIIMKCLLVLAALVLVGGLTCGIVFSNKEGCESIAWACYIAAIAIPLVILFIFYLISCTLKDEKPNNKDFKIKYYTCTLETDIQSRMRELYGQTYSLSGQNNYYSAYHKKNEVVIITVLHISAQFNEDEFVGYMNEITEVGEKSICHTLIVIFIEEEKSQYLKEIIYASEYNSLWDTKIFCVYDKEKNKLKVNKTNSGTGDKAYNDARKDLDKIFMFQKEINKK